MGENPRGGVNYHELNILYSRFMQKKPSLFSMIVGRSKFVFCMVLTVAQVIDVKALFHIWNVQMECKDRLMEDVTSQVVPGFEGFLSLSSPSNSPPQNRSQCQFSTS